MAKKLDQRLPDKDTLWDVHGVTVLKDLVRSRAYSVEISRDSWCLLEIVYSHHLIIIKGEEPLYSGAF